MRKRLFVYRSELPAPAEEVFAWHARPGAFDRYNPPWDPVELVESRGTIEPGASKTLRLRMGPFTREWVAEHREMVPGRLFRDVQVRGPFAHWEHTHLVEPRGADRCVLEDRVEYALPLGPLGDWLGRSFTRAKLNQVFAYRHNVVRRDVAALHQRREHRPMNVLISGATGLVGKELTAFLTAGGHAVTALTRQKNGAGVHWDPDAGLIEAHRLDGFDAVVHLAGESIVGRWSEEKKRRIRDSRVNGTRLLCEALAKLPSPPKVLVSASAIGYYGDRGDEILTEESGPGDSFLPRVCVEWEQATAPAEAKGIRVVHARIGVILSPRGGALAKMLFPFRMGGGGVIGSGKQWFSWAALDDIVGGLHHALQDESLRGPVNLVSPHPVTNREFTKALGRVLWRPTVFPLPAFMARVVFGEMADELLLASTRVQPTRLLATGYQFRHPALEDALRHLLGRRTDTPEPVGAA